MEDKKTFTGPELAQAILDGKFKKGTKFKSTSGCIYKIVDCIMHYGDISPSSSLWDENEQRTPTSNELIYNTFTLIKEPRLMYLSQAAREDKKIKLKDWKDYYLTDKVLDYLRCEDKETIKEALTKRVWEVEE